MRSAQWDPAFEKKLLGAEDYRSFLRLFFDKSLAREKPRPLSYRDFANRAGFSSKAFMRDIIVGKKRLTVASFERVSSALQLSSAWRSYLRHLVAAEEPKFRGPRESEREVRGKVESLRKELGVAKRTLRHAKTSPVIEVFLKENFPDVYASLGTQNEGATREEIAARSGLGLTRVTSILREMETAGLVDAVSLPGRYLAVAPALEAVNLKDQAIFQQDFKRALERARRRLNHQCASDKSLFMTQTFSVSLEKLPALKAELAELIARFAEASENPTGDTVSELLISFTNSAPPRQQLK
jgi:uncharacterized protein (TIGR02147 family)